MMDTNARFFVDVSKTAQFIVSFKKNCKHSGCFLLVFVGSDNFLAPYVVSSNFQKVVILIQQINGCLPWLNVPYYSFSQMKNVNLLQLPHFEQLRGKLIQRHPKEVQQWLSPCIQLHHGRVFVGPGLSFLRLVSKPSWGFQPFEQKAAQPTSTKRCLKKWILEGWRKLDGRCIPRPSLKWVSIVSSAHTTFYSF